MTPGRGAGTPRNVAPVAAAPGYARRLRQELQGAAGTGLVWLLVVCAAGVVGFVDLDRPSINTKDEFLHISATQEMWQSGRWWQPTVDGRPYFNKPPLKMWVTFLPLVLLGESTAVYRLPDALIGLVLASIVFFLSWRLFGSRTAAAAAALSLYGCERFVFVHGVRMANQDVALVLLSTLAVLAGVAALSGRPLASTGAAALGAATIDRRAAVAGSLVGLAVLVKSVAGFVAIPILAGFVLLALVRGGFRRPRLRTLFAFALPAAALPALWFVPHAWLTPGALETFLGYEIVQRTVGGYHHADQPLFFLRELFVERTAFPPELMVLGLAIALALWWREREPLYGLLVAWAVVPVALYSLIPSRLPWYILPAFPALAVLVGAVVAKGLEMAASTRKILLSIGALGLVTWSLARVGVHYGYVLAQAFDQPAPIVMDTIMRGLQDERDAGLDVGLVLTRPSFVGKHERPYVKMLRPETVIAARKGEVQRALARHEAPVLLTAARGVEDLLRLRPATAYHILPGWAGRARWLWLVWYSSHPAPDFFTPVERRIDFGEAKAKTAYGLEGPLAVDGDWVRRSRGPRAGIPVPGDPVLRRFGTGIELRLTALPETPAGTRLRVFANEVEVAMLSLDGSTAHRLEVPGDTWTAGTNVLGLVPVLPDGRIPGPRESLFLLKKARFSVRLPGTA